MDPARILSLLLAVSLPASAAARTFTLGGGLNFSSMNLDENADEPQNPDYAMRTGFNAGIGLEFYLSPRFALSPGLLIETRGQKLKAEAEDSTGFGPSGLDVTYKFLYLQVPLHVRAALPLGRQAGLHVFGGPELGITLSSEATVRMEFMGQSIKASGSIDSKAFDVGVSLGAGLRMPVGAVGLFVEPSYYYGFLDVAIRENDPDTPEDESEQELHSQNRNFKLRAGICKEF